MSDAESVLSRLRDVYQIPTAHEDAGKRHP
jgi:hypothetical protein